LATLYFHRYVKCRYVFIVMLDAIMLSIAMLKVIRFSGHGRIGAHPATTTTTTATTIIPAPAVENIATGWPSDTTEPRRTTSRDQCYITFLSVLY
jgi:hypothetical protein